MTKKHTKHSTLNRPKFGDYGRVEIALVGTKCSIIQEVANAIIKRLSSDYSIAYVDSDHSAFDNPNKGDYLDAGASSYVIDKQESYALKQNAVLSKWDSNVFLNDKDVVLLNGNHHKGQNQILFVDGSKEKSVIKRLNQLTNVIGLIHVDGNLPKEVSDHVNANHIPTFSLNQHNEIAGLVELTIKKNTPPIKALILAGGKSTRMGADKATLVYNQQKQLDRISEVLQTSVNNVFVSIRPDQSLDTNLPTITDAFYGLGPMGAILSAFQSDPNAAWLVVACDLPFVDESVLDELISQRSSKHIATAFLNHETGFAEPLIALWEPKSYMRMLQFLAMGYSCPRKVLINSDTHLLTPSNPSKLANINTPEEYRLAKERLD